MFPTPAYDLKIEDLININQMISEYNSSLNKTIVNNIEDLEKLFREKVVSYFMITELFEEFENPKMGGAEGRILFIDSNENFIEEEFILFNKIKIDFSRIRDKKERTYGLAALFRYNRRDQHLKLSFRFIETF